MDREVGQLDLDLGSDGEAGDLECQGPQHGLQRRRSERCRFPGDPAAAAGSWSPDGGRCVSQLLRGHVPGAQRRVGDRQGLSEWQAPGTVEHCLQRWGPVTGRASVDDVRSLPLLRGHLAVPRHGDPRTVGRPGHAPSVILRGAQHRESAAQLGRDRTRPVTRLAQRITAACESHHRAAFQLAGDVRAAAVDQELSGGGSSTELHQHFVRSHGRDPAVPGRRPHPVIHRADRPAETVKRAVALPERSNRPISGQFHDYCTFGGTTGRIAGA
jgi:hypothetical protein